MSWALLTTLVALIVGLLAFAAGWLVGRMSRRGSPDAAMAAENADLRRRMDQLADALLATDTGASP